MTQPDRDEAATPRPDAASRVHARRRPAGADASAAGERDGKPADLADVVASLVRPTTAEVVVEGRDLRDGALLLERRQVTVRPLLAELRAEVVPGGESGGSGRGGGVPLSVDVADVVRDLELLVRGQLAACGLRRRSSHGRCVSCSATSGSCLSRGRDEYGPPIIGTYGMHCCSHCQHPEPPDPIADGLAQLVPARWPTAGARQAFTDRLAELVATGRAVLDGLTSSTYVRDTRCPVCHVEWVAEPVAGGWDRHPALRVNRGTPDPDGTPGPVRGTVCTNPQCGGRWSWADMQGPTAGEPAGKLWQLLAADAEVLAAGRRQREQDDRARELAERDRYAGAGVRELGLPRDAPAPRSKPAERPQPPPIQVFVRADAQAIRDALDRSRRMDA